MSLDVSKLSHDVCETVSRQQHSNGLPLIFCHLVRVCLSELGDFIFFVNQGYAKSKGRLPKGTYL